MAIDCFSELSDLKNMINKDTEEFSISSHRFPVRFIFLNSHEELKEVVDLLIGTAKKVELSSFLLKDDGWLTPEDIKDNIKNLNENSIVVPLSEYLRFLDNEKFNNIINSLTEIENKPFRIYIPLVGLWERFEEFYKNFFRKDEWAPIWKLISPNKSIKIYQISFDFNKNIEMNNLKLISNTKEWFEFWKDDEFSSIVSLARPILLNFKYSLPDQTFSQEIISSPKEYLYKIFGVDINVPYNDGEKQFWDDLLIYVSKKNKKNISLKNIFIDEFNKEDVSKIKIEEFLNLYLSNINNSYKQWLIKNFFLVFKEFEDNYLWHCFNSLGKLGNNNLSRKIFLEIFELEYSEKYLDERRVLLHQLNKFDLSFAENEFEEYFNKINHLNYKKQLLYLTTSTLVEKEKIIDILYNNGLDNIFSDLKIIFPELYYYLDWNLNLNCDIPSWILNYFSEYNKSKVLNFKSSTLDELLSKNNHPDKFYEWYFKFNNNAHFNDEDNYIVWIDGLGSEWLPLLNYELNYFGKFNNKKVKYKSINSVNLPSATEFNKIDADKKISYLDEYIHKNHYNYPKSLLDEIESIKDIARKIVKIDSPKITIVSDHGFSFLCTKEFGGFKKYTFKSSKHEGRYLLWDKEDVANEDYMSTDTESPNHGEQKYIVPLRHISLYNTPSHEVHGGATPEEVLVPYIVLENDDGVIDYNIVPLKSSINISNDNLLGIKISPQPSSLPMVIWNNEPLHVLKEKNNQYMIQLNSNIGKGMQKFVIKIDDDEVGELEINIKKGGMEEEEYDFG